MLSDKYAAWRDYYETPRGLGLLSGLIRENKPLRLSGEKLARHRSWSGEAGDPDCPPLPDYLAVPLIGRDGANLGLIQLSDKLDGTGFSPEDEAMLVQLAQMASAAIESIELVARERRARAAAEESARQRTLLSDASRIFAASLEVADILDDLVKLVVPRLADWCAVHLLEDQGDASLRAVTHRDPEQAPVLRQVLEQLVVLGDGPVLTSPAARTVEGPILSEITDELLATCSDDPEQRRQILGLGIRTAIVVPLTTPAGRTLGAVTMCRGGGNPYTEAEVVLFEDLAGRCAQALETARLYLAEREAATILQQSLLPQALPMSSALTAAARYFPGAQGRHVGGDWYDLVDLGQDRLGMVIGDVMGRGVTAAAVMGQLRASVRAYALDGHPPADILDRLDLVVQGIGGLQLTTCVYGVLDQASGTLTLATAGHLPPLLIPESGEPFFLDLEPGLILGVGGTGFTEGTFELPAGATLLFYTDGLVEDADDSLAAGLERLRVAAHPPVQSPDELCDRVLLAMGRERDHHDDIALLAVTRRARSSAHEVAAIELPPEGASVHAARCFVGEALAGLGIENQVEATRLLVSELVTNAVHYAASPLRVQLTVEADTLRVDVRDETPEMPHREPLGPLAEGGRGLQIVDALSSRWGVEALPPGKRVWFELDLDTSSRSSL